VWLVIHPTDISSYFVQPRATSRAGEWKAKVYVGRRGKDYGATFEIKAFGDPIDPLQEGWVLDYWPEAGVESESVEFTKAR
jgi:hypothetical protein